MKALIAASVLSIIIAGCKLSPDNKMNDAAVIVSGVFIKDSIQSFQSLRIKGGTVVNNDPDSTYHVAGMVEGFSPMNYPVSMEHFSETLHYSGGDPKEPKNWKCVEIYLGNKK